MASVMAIFSEVVTGEGGACAKPRILYIEPTSARYRILLALSKCRGYRAYSQSLVSCLDGDDRSERRLHNTCTTLFRHGLIEKVRGMYQLTPAGLDLAGNQ